MIFEYLALLFGALSTMAAIILWFSSLRIKELKSDVKDYRDLYYNQKETYEKLLAKQKEPQERPKSIELQEFLTDLLQGDALISVQRVDNSNLFMYSPREK